MRSVVHQRAESARRTIFAARLSVRTLTGRLVKVATTLTAPLGQ